MTYYAQAVPPSLVPDYSTFSTSYGGFAYPSSSLDGGALAEPNVQSELINHSCPRLDDLVTHQSPVGGCPRDIRLQDTHPTGRFAYHPSYTSGFYYEMTPSSESGSLETMYSNDYDTAMLHSRISVQFS